MLLLPEVTCPWRASRRVRHAAPAACLSPLPGRIPGFGTSPCDDHDTITTYTAVICCQDRSNTAGQIARVFPGQQAISTTAEIQRCPGPTPRKSALDVILVHHGRGRHQPRIGGPGHRVTALAGPECPLLFLRHPGIQHLRGYQPAIINRSAPQVPGRDVVLALPPGETHQVKPPPAQKSPMSPPDPPRLRALPPQEANPRPPAPPKT